MGSKNGNTLTYRVNCVEKKLDKIMDNHLPHIQKDIIDLRLDILNLKTRVNIVGSIQILVVIIGIIIAVIMQ